MKILLVEDEAQTARYLRKGLVQNGFAVDVMGAGAVEGTPPRGQYDLLVCDMALARLPEIRQEREPLPVLFLADRKTFAFGDFLARVQGLLGSAADAKPMSLRVGGLELDLVRHRASREGRRLELTPKEFLLLSLLMRRSGEVLSRAVIADQVWEINFESNTNFVDVHIRRLRSKVDDPFPKRLIHTVRGMGYVLEER